MDKKRIWKKILTGVVIASMYAGIVGVHLYRNNLDRDMVIVEESWEDEDVPLAEQPGGIDSTAILTETLAYVPANITTRMVNDGWVFNITNEDLSNKYFAGKYRNVMAVTDSRIKTIWLYNTERAIRSSAIHEMGHYIDYVLGYADRTSQFQAIYQAEKAVFVVEGGSASQAKSSSLEYFAEAFQEAILHPASLQQCAPQTYAYMQSLIANFK
ncbi:MAG: hypothetical protein IIW54_10950 [Lachnospiraceae bacterium]|nr:hypothetical protein [Lachnospiraceae bacterium]